MLMVFEDLLHHVHHQLVNPHLFLQHRHHRHQMLHKMEKCLNKVIKGVGGLSHQKWRSFFNERKNEEASGFIDGDLIESYLDLKKERMDEVAQLMGMDADELSKQVEELARLH